MGYKGKGGRVKVNGENQKNASLYIPLREYYIQ